MIIISIIIITTIIIITSVLLSIYIDNEAEKAMSQAGIGGSFGSLLAALKYTVMSV